MGRPSSFSGQLAAGPARSDRLHGAWRNVRLGRLASGRGLSVYLAVPRLQSPQAGTPAQGTAAGRGNLHQAGSRARRSGPSRRPMDEQAPHHARASPLMVVGAASRSSPSRSGRRRTPTGTWPCSAILLAFSVFSDLTAVATESKVKISGSFLALVLAMVFLGGTPAALIGVITILVGWLRWRDEPALPAQQPPHLRGLPAGRRHRLPRGRRRRPGSPPPTRPSTCCVFGALPARAGDQLRDDRRLRAATSSAAPSSSKVRTVLIPLLPSELAAALMAVGVAFIYDEIGLAGDRPLRRRPGHLPVPARRTAALPAARRGAGAAQQAAGQLPGRDVERDAAHARPAGPDDRPPLAPPSPATRGRSPSAPASRAARRSWSTSPRCCTTSASSSFPTASSRPTCRSPTRTGC